MEQDDTAALECVSSVIPSKGKNVGISFGNPKNRLSSVSFTGEDYDAAENDDAASKNMSEVVNSPHPDRRPHRPPPPCLVLEHQHLLDRYGCCLSRLREAENHTELLHREITYLRLANRDLSERMFFLLHSSFQKPYDIHGYNNHPAPATIANGFRGLCISENPCSSNSRMWEEEDRLFSPGLIETDHSRQRIDVQRTTLPKCISVRSSGYLMTQSGSGLPRNCSRIRQPNTVVAPTASYDLVVAEGVCEGSRERRRPGAGGVQPGDVQNGALQQMAGDRGVSLRGQLPVRPWNQGAPASNPPSPLQNGALPNGAGRGQLPVRAQMPLPPRPHGGGDSPVAEQGSGRGRRGGGRG